MADFTRLQKLAADSRASAAGLDRQLAELGGQVRAARAEFDAARRAGNANALQAARDRLDQLAANRRQLGAARAHLQDALAGALGPLLGRDLVLEADAPLVLLPVRIGVRSTANGAALRVRVFPDSIHAESLDEGIDADERAAGMAYWNEAWSSGDTQAPWARLVSAVGSRRAAWIAHALTPSNLAARPGVAPVFPDRPARTGDTTRARTLPDRFFVRIEQDGAAPLTVRGALIPDELPIGLRDESVLEPLELADNDVP